MGSRIASLSFFALPLLLGFAAPDRATPAQSAGPPCVESRAEARAAHPGYNHVVVLNNRCDPTYTCTVTTDASPDAVFVEVPGRTEVEVVTFRGSPASAFHHRTECEKKK